MPSLFATLLPGMLATTAAQVSAAIGTPSTPAEVQVRASPQQIWIEEGEGTRFVNSDFDIYNLGRDAIELISIQATVRDADGTPVSQKLLSENGEDPGILTVVNRRIPAGSSATTFNPFYAWPTRLPLDRIDFILTFRHGDGRSGRTEAVSVSISPKPYLPKTALHLPLRGRILVWDGHDFYSHHRRVGYAYDYYRRHRISRNNGRFAYDLAIVDKDGRMFRGDGSRNADWYSWNQPIYAPAAGTIVQTVTDMPDQSIAAPNFPFDSEKDDPWKAFGNHVLIRHQDGTVSVLAHLRNGSVNAKVGERVRRGQELGRVGFSGSVVTIHAHYQLQDSSAYNSEGLPSYFSDFERLRGSRSENVERGQIDTGDIVRQR